MLNMETPYGSGGRGGSSGIVNSIIGWAYLVQLGVAGESTQPECLPYQGNGAVCRGQYTVLLHPKPYSCMQ